MLACEYNNSRDWRDIAPDCAVDLHPHSSSIAPSDYLSHVTTDRADAWRKYLAHVYGSEQVAAFPPSDDHIRFLWNTAPDRARLLLPQPAHFRLGNYAGGTCLMEDGQLWAPGCVDFTNRTGYADAPAGQAPQFPGVFVARARAYAELPQDDTWAEVVHIARDEDHSEEEDRASEGQFWYWHAPGSGIWLNVGRALRMPTVGIVAPGCRKAVAEGFDTIILHGNATMATDSITYGSAVELVDCRAARAGASLGEEWTGSCPPPLASPLRMGLPNHDHGAISWSCECRCDPSYSYTNCLG